MSIKTALLYSALILAVSTTVTGAATTDKWSWLAGTYWFVPEKNLSAYTYTPSTNLLSPTPDQTVFQLAGYANGYFWGNVVGQSGTNPPSCQSLVGSVTPEGKVYLNFNVLPFTPGSSPTIGLGDMVKKGGQWTMVNQMSTGVNAFQVGHWAYMVQTKPGQTSWTSLPGTSLDVPSFLAQCPNNTPKTTSGQ